MTKDSDSFQLRPESGEIWSDEASFTAVVVVVDIKSSVSCHACARTELTDKNKTKIKF